MKDIAQLKIVLEDTKPPIWRRVLVDIDTTFLELHYIIQQSMGWEMAHLYEFEYDNYKIGESDGDFEGLRFDKVIEASTVTLKDVISFEKSKIKYEYDFGDSWRHIITVEKFLERDDKINYPTCIKAKLACPLEDCGGVWGYYGFLNAIKDENHPEHEEYLDWYGDFDEEEVNIKTINKCLLPIVDAINERKGTVKELSKDLQEKESQLLALIQRFCDHKLDKEYLDLCNQVVFKMSKKAKIPFKRGKLEIWAAAIIYAVGSINFLFDKSSNQFNVKSQDISDFFQTKNSTITNKARTIKDMFDMTYFDDEFSTQNMKENNPFNEMVMVDGLIVPISTLPVELQQQVKEARDRGEDIQFFTED